MNQMAGVTGRGRDADWRGIGAGWFRGHCSPLPGSLLPHSGFIAPNCAGSLAEFADGVVVEFQALAPRRVNRPFLWLESEVTVRVRSNRLREPGSTRCGKLMRLSATLSPQEVVHVAC